MLAVVFFTKYFKYYLLGHLFILRTDHGSLRWLHHVKVPEGHVQRWLQQLSQFDFDIVHRPGLKYGNADAMSRLVRGDTPICRQCKMQWSDAFKLSNGSCPVKEELELQVNLDILKNSEDESIDEGDAANTNVDSPVPQLQKRRPGRKTNKPVIAEPRDHAEKNIDIEPLKKISK